MHDTKERLSVLWIFALLNYLYADVIALWAILGAPPADTPHLGQLALAGSAILMEIRIAMILASRLLPLRANRLANIIAGSIVRPELARKGITCKRRHRHRVPKIACRVQ